MNNQINQKIKNILKDLHVAHKKSEQFYAKQLNPDEPVKPVDFFKMALVFDREDRLLVALEFAYCEKYPNRYTTQQKDFLNKERKRLDYRIRAWQNRQFPS